MGNLSVSYHKGFSCGIPTATWQLWKRLLSDTRREKPLLNIETLDIKVTLYYIKTSEITKMQEKKMF